MVDDRSDQSPYGDTPVAELEEDGTVVPAPADDSADLTTGTIATGSEVAQSGTFQAMVGRWGETTLGCDQNGAYAISPTTVERPGRICEVSELIDAGEGSVTAALLCSTGEGRTDERELLRLSIQDDALNLNIVGSPNPPTTLQRCPL